MQTRLFRIAFVLFVGLSVTSCGDAAAPQGRWEGFKETANWLLAVRLEVESGNSIRASALSINITGLALPERYALQSKLKQALIDQWPRAVKGQVDFRDNVLIRHGGVAPLFAFDPQSRIMTFHFYARGKLTEKVTCTPVTRFNGT